MKKTTTIPISLFAIRSLLCLAALFPMPVFAEGKHWQLSLKYSQAGTLDLISANPIASAKKTPRAPNRDGGIFEIPVNIDWLDSKGEITFSTNAVIPLGTRIPIADTNLAPGVFQPEEVVVLRVAGPDPAENVSEVKIAGIELPNAGLNSFARNRPKLLREFTFPLGSKAETFSFPPPGPLSSTKIRDTGDDGDRLVFVILGDGYVQSEIDNGKYAADVTRTIASFSATEPWTQMLGATNIYRIDVVSNQSGADYENAAPGAGGILKDTYFDTAFHTQGIERLLTPSDAGRLRAIAAADNLIGAGLWDQIIIIVNSPVYGGAGGLLSVNSMNSQGPLISVHEVAHTIAGLADEYDLPTPIYDGLPITEPNVDTNPFSPKWRIWIDTLNPPPLPTPDISEYSSTVGAFEGARYIRSGVYRPWSACKMRFLNSQFCPVCKEQHLKSFFEIVPFTNSVSPAQATTSQVSSSQAFTVNSVAIGDITYEWFLDGQKIQGETSSTLLLSTAELPAPSQQISVNASYTSGMMRSGQPSDSFSWTVNNTGMTPAKTPHWWLAANNLGVEPGDDQDDPDNDGQPSAAEYLAGTNPQEKSSVLQFSTVSIAPTGGLLEFQTIPGRSYRLECATNLDNWRPVTGYEDIDGNSGSVQYTLPDTTDTARFYRIAVWIP